MKSKIKVWAAAACVTALVLSGCSFPAFWQGDETLSSQVGEAETEPGPEISEPEGTIEPFPGTEPQSEEETESADGSGETEYDGYEKKLILATDIHYFAPELTDGGTAFHWMVNQGDGKVVQYISQITEAFVAEALEEKPDAVILSGDLSLDGEKLSHVALTRKLQPLRRAGIPVLVIPGNHDINNPAAAGYLEDGTYPASPTSPEEFEQIYEDFGYGQADSRDPYSLSYTYRLDDMTMLLMLDSCQYENGNKVGGVIRNGTYEWLDQVLEEAWDNGMNVIPVAHHNLLEESELYVLDCTIEHSEELEEKLSAWDVCLFLSGHLHVQHMKEENGIYEIVTSSLATPLCQYGVLTYRDDTSFVYDTKVLDVSGWARRTGETSDDLKNFDTFREPFLERVFRNQAYRELENQQLSETQKENMAAYFARLKYYYYQGKSCLIYEEMAQDPALELWEEVPGDLYDLIAYMLSDSGHDYNHLEVE